MRKAELTTFSKDGSSENPTNISQLHCLSDEDFREEMLRIFKEHK